MYTQERNVQILISVLKYHNIKKIIASPGTLNVSFVGSVQNDPFFEVYSCIDERSACYMACGLAEESGEPVVLTCTGATASRNYMPGLTEAYYRKLPILAVTCAQHFSRLDNNVPQAIDRTSIPKDIVNLSVQIPKINSLDDEYGCNLLINKAILELKYRGGGPVHINMVTYAEKSSFPVLELPKTRVIDRIEIFDKFPDLDAEKRIAIFIGNHTLFSDELVSNIEHFCELYNAIVLCDHSSNYYGNYKILPNIIFDQDNYVSPLNNFDILIHIGQISGSYLNLNVKEVWRVNPDGKLVDTYKKLRYMFDMDENYFFKYYSHQNLKKSDLSNYIGLKKEFDELENKIGQCDLPFSNIWVASCISQKLPPNCYLYLSILNTLRSWNYFEFKETLHCSSNTGGFGIDGSLSTSIGASLNNKKLYFCIVGDLSFFYDMNSLGNKNINNKLRILLINNGCGTEFHNYSHPAAPLGDKVSDFIAADGHYGNKSKTLVKHYCEDLGFKYISASSKDEFLQNVDEFTSEVNCDKPILFEVFTNSGDESLALKNIRNLKKSPYGIIKNSAKKILSDKTKQKIKKIIGR